MPPSKRPQPWPSRRGRFLFGRCTSAAIVAVALVALAVLRAVAVDAAQAALPTAIIALAGVVGFLPPPLQLLLARTPPWAESCSRRPPLSPPSLQRVGAGAAARPSSAAAATLQHPPPPSQRSRPPDERLRSAAAVAPVPSAAASVLTTRTVLTGLHAHAVVLAPGFSAAMPRPRRVAKAVDDAAGASSAPVPSDGQHLDSDSQSLSSGSSPAIATAPSALSTGPRACGQAPGCSVNGSPPFMSLSHRRALPAQRKLWPLTLLKHPREPPC